MKVTAKEAQTHTAHDSDRRARLVEDLQHEARSMVEQGAAETAYFLDMARQVLLELPGDEKAPS